MNSQGSKGIRQWWINHIIYPSVDYNQRLDTQVNEPTNQNSI